MNRELSLLKGMARAHHSSFIIHHFLFVVLGLALLVGPRAARAQAGALRVEGAEEPDEASLALVEMDVGIRLDHLHATVTVTQVFENHTDRPLRGRYELALSRGAAVSSFAIWEGVHRRAAAVVERQRGRRVFEELTSRNIDPGLLETADEDARRDVYAVRVDPIPAFGRVRIEVGYSQEIDLVADEALFTFPLAAREHATQHVGRLVVDLAAEGAWPVDRVELSPEGFTLAAPPAPGATGFRARLEARNIALEQDLSVSVRLTRMRGQPLRPVLLAYRRPFPEGGLVDRSAFGGGHRYMDDRGYFVIRTPAQFALPTPDGAEPHDIVVALDTSLSMRGGKLERAVASVEEVLDHLGPADRFGLLTFHDQVDRFSDGLGPATPERIAQARRFFRSGYLSGGTDLAAALPAALALLRESRAPRRTVVVITDGQVSLGEVGHDEVASAVARANADLGARRARFFIVGVGDDADHALLDRIARESEGAYSHIGEGADPAPVLRGLLHQLEAQAIDGLRLDGAADSGLEDLYPAGPTRVLDGSMDVIYGRYRDPNPHVRMRIAGRVGSRELGSEVTGALPRQDTDRPWIARGWARRRIDDLLARIDADGERLEWVEEIVALAREHMMVTPYTSLIAAARSLLRPREIQPGDPVLRVRTDPADRAVVALFPFGPITELRRLEPGLFETRFLAPPDLAEGRHEVELVITGPDDSLRRTRDAFVIDSRAPEPRIEPPEQPVRAGERLRLEVRSDQDTRHLVVYLAGRGPLAELRWSASDLACVGELVVDPTLPTGSYPLVVVAEDHAHNIGSSSVQLEVTGR